MHPGPLARQHAEPGGTEPVTLELKRVFAMRIYQRSRHVDGTLRTDVLRQVGLTAN